MPATGFSRIDPGTTALHTVLGTRLTGMESAVNNLPLEGVEPHSLTRQHLPSVIVGTPSEAVLGNAIGSESEYSSQVGAEPYPGWNTVAGWKVVNDVGTATGPNLLRVSGLGVALSTTVGIEVWASAEIVDIELWDYTAGPPTTESPLVTRCARVMGVFAIQYSNDAVTWYHIPRTERYFRAETANDASIMVAPTTGQTISQQLKRMTIATLIRSTDAGGAITVNYVRMVVSCWRAGFIGADQHVRVRLRQGNINAQGIQFGTLS